jgi:hypothetical protein
MKPKQLANVLIKILGLSVVVHSIPSLVTELLPILQPNGMRSMGAYFWVYPFSTVMLIALGIYLIVASRKIAECLFKDEGE